MNESRTTIGEEREEPACVTRGKGRGGDGGGKGGKGDVDTKEFLISYEESKWRQKREKERARFFFLRILNKKKVKNYFSCFSFFRFLFPPFLFSFPPNSP